MVGVPFGLRLLLLRSGLVRVWLFWRACQAHPIVALAGLTWFTVWISSGSGWTALAVTMAFWVGGSGLWFEYRKRRTGLTYQENVGQLRRQRLVRAQWDDACVEAGLRVTPPLRPWHVRSEGTSVVARFSASRAGIARDSIVSGLRGMAQVVGGGCRGATMRALGESGVVEVRFDFAAADPLAKVITPNMLPAAPKGCIPYGISEEGTPVYFRLLNEMGECVFTPTLVVGASRSGKSSTVWGMLLGFISAGVPVEIYAGDPKGGMELTALEDALNRRAGTDLFKVVEYADDPDGDGKKIVAMVKRLEKRMNDRMVANKGRRKRAHIPTVAEPFLLLLLDELLLCDELLSAGKKGPLGRIQLAGAAAGCSVIGCTQLSRTQDLNAQIRDLFLRRFVFRVPSKEAVETALGSGNGWSEKAPAHKIRDRAEEKGIGFTVDTEGMTSSSTEAVRFRSVWIDDEATGYIAQGEMPPGTERFASAEVQEQTFWHAHYLFFDEVMALVYTGETNDFDRRLAEHRTRSPWFGEVVEDSDHMRVTWYDGKTAKEAEAKAKAAESAAIRKMKPRHNKAENRNNPLRRVA
jgi:predicted GIY-YIG superfamily endonuclease